VFFITLGETVTISGFTIRNGHAGNAGGGIDNEDGSTLTVTNCTVSGNTAGLGGGIFNGGPLTIGSITVSGNSAANGGGIYNSGGGTATSTNSNFSGNTAAPGVLTGPGDQINTNPMLGPLQNNGGPTFTHALLPGSPAINTGDPIFTPPPSFDQCGQGFVRVVSGRIDIGSFEVQAAPGPQYQIF